MKFWIKKARVKIGEKPRSCLGMIRAEFDELVGSISVKNFTFIAFTSIVKFIDNVISKTFTHWPIAQMETVASIAPVSS